MKINLGPAGTPAKSTIEGLSAIRQLGLQAMEVQFSHGIGMGLPLAKQIGQENKKYGVVLSIHAPYYINLTSTEKRKIKESKQRILSSCERGHLMGADNIVFHAAYYGKQDKEEIYRHVKEEILDMTTAIEKKKWDVKLCPETTGKHTQFGTLDELIRLSGETNCNLCVDFAHLYARNNGKVDYKGILKKLRHFRQMHCHFSNINFSEKGELNHLNMDHKPPFEPLAKQILKARKNITIISETPITWKDSLKMKKVFEALGYKF
jgi:deoxyribonuclease-4